MNTSGTCFSAFTASVWLSEMFTIMFVARAGRIERRRGPADPAVLVAAVRRRGVPERHRREVRERRLVVADALHDRHLALVVQVLHAAHRLVPAEVRVDLQHVLLLDADRRPVLVVQRVAVRHDRVQPVVAAEPLEDDEDLAVRVCGDALARLRQDGRHRAEAADRPKPRPPAPMRIRSRRETPLALRGSCFGMGSLLPRQSQAMARRSANHPPAAPPAIFRTCAT